MTVRAVLGICVWLVLAEVVCHGFVFYIGVGDILSVLREWKPRCPALPNDETDICMAAGQGWRLARLAAGQGWRLARAGGSRGLAAGEGWRLARAGGWPGLAVGEGWWFARAAGAPTPGYLVSPFCTLGSPFSFADLLSTGVKTPLKVS